MRYRIYSKIALNGLAPNYTCGMLTPYKPDRCLRSSDRALLFSIKMIVCSLSGVLPVVELPACGSQMCRLSVFFSIFSISSLSSFGSLLTSMLFCLFVFSCVCVNILTFGVFCFLFYFFLSFFSFRKALCDTVFKRCYINHINLKRVNISLSC